MTQQRLLPPAAAHTVLSPSVVSEAGRYDVAQPGDTAWLLACSLFALLALAGVGLFHAGRVRRKNALAAIAQTGTVFAISCVLWTMVGYTLAFGHVSGGWLGAGNAWMLINLGNVREGTQVPETAFALLHMMFAAMAPALMTGAAVERARLGWILTFSALWSLVVYAPVAHWIWGGGWLSLGTGTLDWSGGLVVNTSAGVSALVVAVMLGRRKGPAGADSPPHSPLLAASGAALVWAGWLALAGGSALTANDDAGAAIIAMHMGTASGALTWIFVERVTSGRSTVVGMALGAMSGMAAISAAAGFVSPGAGIVFGIAGAMLASGAMHIVKRKLRIDDALGVFAVNGVSGMAGSLLLAVFLLPSLGGVGYAAGMNPVAQLVAQATGVAVVGAWSAVATVILTLMASLAFPMRVSEDAERDGLDATTHGERAWNFE